MNFGGFDVGNREPLFLIAGPCVIESRELVFEVAGRLLEITHDLNVHLVVKASFDKANRTSHRSYRGPGIEAGLRILEDVRNALSVPVLTDVHENTPLDEVASVVDVLQTPAFLVRQTDFITRVAATGKPMNVKKGQFQAPWDMQAVVDKCRAAGNENVMLCERGATFGYNNLVSDMRGLAVMRKTGCPVIFDATHSVQEPGGLGSVSGGRAEHVPLLARAAVAAGVAGIFMETHPRPEDALSDGPNMWPLGRMRELLEVLVAIDRVVKAQPFAEDERPSAPPSSAPAPKRATGLAG
jgi:2-dehydro-3-deoxyphosphooctonate aldolase (KDO 8-P synthase)